MVKLWNLGILAMCLSTAASIACADDGRSATERVQQRNLSTVRQLIAMSEEKDLDAMLSIFDAEAVFSQPFQPSGPALYRGKAEIRAGYQRLFGHFDTVRYGDEQFTVSADGRTVFAELQGDFELVGGAGEYDNFFIFRVDFGENGRVARLTQYQNSLHTARIFEALRSRNEQTR